MTGLAISLYRIDTHIDRRKTLITAHPEALLPVQRNYHPHAPFLTGENAPSGHKAVERMVGTANEHYTTIPTEHGQVRLHDGHGKGERQENIRVASYFANKYGYKIDLLDNPDGVKSADSYNQSLDRFEEYKVNTTPSKNSIDRQIRDARKQADHIVLWIDSDISIEDLSAALRSRVKRCDTIKTVTIIRKDNDVCLTRDDILNEGLKIRLADLR